jgi:hypothetical protein
MPPGATGLQRSTFVSTGQLSNVNRRVTSPVSPHSCNTASTLVMKHVQISETAQRRKLGPPRFEPSLGLRGAGSKLIRMTVVSMLLYPSQPPSKVV